VAHLDHVFLRGSRIRFMIIPDMLKNAPMFKRIDPKHKVLPDPIGTRLGLSDWRGQHRVA
jgi:small nuclear ribonucleoprotein D3